MCRLGRTRRKKYEGRGEKRCGVARTDEARKWMKDREERSRGMETLIAETLAKIKPTDPLRLVNQSVRRNRN